MTAADWAGAGGMEKGSEGGIADAPTAAFRAGVRAGVDGKCCGKLPRPNLPGRLAAIRPTGRASSLSTRGTAHEPTEADAKRACCEPVLPEDLTNEVMANWHARAMSGRGVFAEGSVWGGECLRGGVRRDKLALLLSARTLSARRP